MLKLPGGSAMARFETATGTLARLVPPGPELDELLGLVRIGVAFKAQRHVGKRPGALANLILDCARRAGPPYRFESVLVELAFAAQRRALLGDRSSIVLDVDKRDEVVTISESRGSREVPFKTLQNHLTTAKKKTTGGKSREGLSRETYPIGC